MRGMCVLFKPDRGAHRRHTTVAWRRRRAGPRLRPRAARGQDGGYYPNGKREREQNQTRKQSRVADCSGLCYPPPPPRPPAQFLPLNGGHCCIPVWSTFTSPILPGVVFIMPWEAQLARRGSWYRHFSRQKYVRGWTRFILPYLFLLFWVLTTPSPLLPSARFVPVFE